MYYASLLIQRCHFAYLNEKSTQNNQKIVASWFGEMHDFRYDCCYDFVCYSELAAFLRSRTMRAPSLASHAKSPFRPRLCSRRPAALWPRLMESSGPTWPARPPPLANFTALCPAVRCLSSFNRKTGESLTLISSASHFVVSDAAAPEDRATFASCDSTDHTLLLPAVLCLMDNAVGVQNFGTKGSRLDMSITGLPPLPSRTRGSMAPTNRKSRSDMATSNCWISLDILRLECGSRAMILRYVYLWL